MGIQSILSGITGISDGGHNTAAEFRNVLTDMTTTLSASTEITSTEITGATISINGGEVMDRIPDSRDFQLFGNQSSSGVIEYNGLSGNTFDTSKFDLGPVKGWVVDNTMSPENPTVTYVDFSGSTGTNPSGLTLTYLATHPVTYIGISGNTVNDIVQSPHKFMEAEHRNMLILGVVIHSNNTTVNAINDAPALGINPTMQIYDVINGIGFFNVGDSANEFYANAGNLTMRKSSGRIFAHSSNYTVDKKNPHIKSLLALDPVSFRYRLQDSTEYSTTNDVDPNNYDLNGILTVVPQHKFTVQRITLFTSNLVRLQYGQNIYDSLDDAEATLSTEDFVVESNISENGLLRGFIILKQGATDIGNKTQAKFINANHFGDANDTVVGNVHRSRIINHTSTNLIEGGIISVNADPTLFDISAGSGVVADNATNPLNPTLTEVTWGAITGQTIDNLGSHNGSLIFLDELGNVVQYPNTFESNGAERRKYIYLGGLGHTDNISITSVFNVPIHNLSPINIFSDFVTSIGPFSISGNRVSNIVGTRQLTKTAGRSYYYGSNYQNDKTNPDLISIDSLSGSTLIRVTGTNILGLGASTNEIDTLNYDANGLGTLVPLSNPNTVTAHRIWHEPTNNLLIFQYGQKAYKDFNTARDGFIAEDYIVPPSLETGAYLVAVLITDSTDNATDLDNALFVPQGKFSGSGGGGSVDTLQSSYDNSDKPEIITDAVRNAIDLRVGSGNDTDNLIVFENTAGDIKATINGEGTITGNFIISNGITPPANATDTGVAGTIAYDNLYVYVCVATNQWKRSPLSAW